MSLSFTPGIRVSAQGDRALWQEPGSSKSCEIRARPARYDSQRSELCHRLHLKKNLGSWRLLGPRSAEENRVRRIAGSSALPHYKRLRRRK